MWHDLEGRQRLLDGHYVEMFEGRQERDWGTRGNQAAKLPRTSADLQYRWGEAGSTGRLVREDGIFPLET